MQVGTQGTGRIVVGVDGSDASVDALAWAGTQARLTGARLVLVTAWHVPASTVAGAYALAAVDWAGGARACQDAAVAQAGDRVPADVERVVLEGHPAFVLLRAAAGADLLVVGSRGHGGFVGMLLGSVSGHVAAHSPCPVVVVRHHEEPAA